MEDLCSVVHEDNNDDEADENTDHDEWWNLHIEYQMKCAPNGIDEEKNRNFSSDESEMSSNEEGSLRYEEEEDHNRHQVVAEECRRAESERGRPRQRSEMGTWRGRERYLVSLRRAFSEEGIGC